MRVYGNEAVRVLLLRYHNFAIAGYLGNRKAQVCPAVAFQGLEARKVTTSDIY